MDFNKKILSAISVIIISLNAIARPAEPVSPIVENNGYEITGNVKGLNEGDKVVAILTYPSSWKMERRDSGYVKNGEFHIKGVVPDGPRFYWLVFAGKRKMHIAIANNEQISLHTNESIYSTRLGFIDNEVTVEGAKFHTSIMLMLSAWFYYDRAVIDLHKYAETLVDSVGFDGRLLTCIFTSIDKLHHALYTDIFTKNAGQLDQAVTMGYVLLADLIGNRSQHASFLVDSYRELPDTEKNSIYGKILGEYARLSIGQIMPGLDTRYPDSSGKLLSVKDILSKDKITLVNFWGTNSPHTKRRHDELKVMNKMYHEKGLNIIAISSDDYVEPWKDYLEKERYPWYNVIDKKGYIVDSAYHEYGNHPDKLRSVTNVLLDPQGKIIAWDVAGVELQWYLWKYLQ